MTQEKAMNRSTIVSVMAASPDPNVTNPVTWQVGSPVPMQGRVPQQGEAPMPGDNATRIMRMLYIDGCIEVFVLPLPGSEMDQAKHGMIFKIMPLAIRTTLSVARFDHWKELLTEAEAVEAAQYDDEEEEEEEGEEEGNDPASGAPSPSPTPQVALAGPPPMIHSGQLIVPAGGGMNPMTPPAQNNA